MASPATASVRRSQRANAGNRLRQLLDEEADAAAVDEFYQQDIFKEEEADEEFQFTGEVEDIVDSDFDISETDEPIDAEPEEDKPKRRERKPPPTGADGQPVVPPRRPPPQMKRPPREVPTFQLDALDSLIAKASAADHDQAPAVKKVKPAVIDPSQRRTSSRASTVTSTLTSEQRRAARELQSKQMVRPARPVERPKTQEERLAEAAETEKLNLASLEAFQKREEERKRANKRVTTLTGERCAVRSLRVTAETDPLKLAGGDEGAPAGPYTRNLVSFSGFSDDALRAALFKSQTPPTPRPVCAITGLPARYFDPLTKKPYASLAAFRVLRDRYAAKAS